MKRSGLMSSELDSGPLFASTSKPRSTTVRESIAKGRAGAALAFSAQVEDEHTQDIDAGWSRRALSVRDLLIAKSLTDGSTFSVNDVREQVGEPARANAWGQVMRTAARRGLIHVVGHERSTSPGNHGRWVPVWAATRSLSGGSRKGDRTENVALSGKRAGDAITF